MPDYDKGYTVVWYEGWSEYRKWFATEHQAQEMIDATGMDPDEFDIVEGVVHA
jgi:hypothetical protein